MLRVSFEGPDLRDETLYDILRVRLVTVLRLLSVDLFKPINSLTGEL